MTNPTNTPAPVGGEKVSDCCGEVLVPAHLFQDEAEYCCPKCWKTYGHTPSTPPGRVGESKSEWRVKLRELFPADIYAFRERKHHHTGPCTDENCKRYETENFGKLEILIADLLTAKEREVVEKIKGMADKLIFTVDPELDRDKAVVDHHALLAALTKEFNQNQ